MVKKILTTLVASLFTIVAIGQIINKDKINLSNFVERLYRNSAFDGVKIVDDYDGKYLLSVVVLDPAKYRNSGGDITMNKIASVKAMSQASRFFNGSFVSAETVIHTSEREDGTSDTEVMEKINENSVGYVKSLELLSSFYDENEHKVFVYFKTIEEDNNSK